MELLEFKHENDPARNRELFGLLGEYAASSSIREKLGGVISSEPGRLWFITTEEGKAKRVTAFGSIRLGKEGPISSTYTHWKKGRTFRSWNVALKGLGKTVQRI